MQKELLDELKNIFILPNNLIIESKGRFTTADRKKHLKIKHQYPDIDIRFVFSSSRAKLYKGSKSTYADWCNKHKFLYYYIFYVN